VAVIGAGVIGLGIGWRLARAGCPVTVFDRGAAGRGASWAAGGMLCGGVETEPGEEALWPLAALSQRLWPDFRDSVEADSGLAVGYRDEGTLVIALTRDDLAQLRFTHAFQTKLGIALTWLSGPEVRAREPFLSAGTVGGVLCRGDHQVDNRSLVGALKSALERVGGTLREHCPVTGVSCAGGRVTGVHYGDDQAFHPAEVVVLAAGAWSDQIPGLPDEVRPPVRPIRGQLLVLGPARASGPGASPPLLNHVVWAPRAYLIPRGDGRLLIGATTEERGFDERPTAGGVYGLLDGAWRALPGVEELPLLEVVVGFRPGSPDDAPIFGPTAMEGLIMATGHHRNGILLAPVTVEAIARAVLGEAGDGELAEVVRPFHAGRFSALRATTQRPHP